ncbi:spore coat associated protein CotJA [Clostridium boliviensis]|uniref:Spore coat associated protein CotJA n=1 Tax=Clostridium boliviensis TaxID=318465 RepID=A0ABU4GMI2_9CLOT|nr:spore coat associated protein CotJA [Clostridium boliviensis]MDW2798805.1 spore coat associated protein CotJA [Clostridium boliviensis]
MDGYTKQQCSDWSSPVELDMSACPGTVIRPDMPLGSGPARNLHNPSTPDPVRQQDLYRCPTYCGPRKCPERGAATSPMKCPEKPVCQMPVKCPQQGVSPATMKCPEIPPCRMKCPEQGVSPATTMKCPPMHPKPMKCPEQGVSPATMKCPPMPPCRMKCPEQGVSPATTMKCPPMPPCRMKYPEQGVSPATTMKCPPMPPCRMKYPEQGVSPATMMKCPPMPACPMKYPDMPPCHMRPEKPMGMAPGMAGGCMPAPAECKGVESIDRYPVAMAYVPWQRWQELYSVDTAIEMGTIFPDLFKPFLMGGCK